MATCISHSPAETESIGEAWGREAESGLVIGLCGELGTGKTQLVKGLARGLGITARVQSPTFALVNVYAGGRLRLFHLDLYRLNTPDQVFAAGLEDYLEPEGVTVIEWAERLGEEEGRRAKGEGRRAEGGEPRAEWGGGAWRRSWWRWVQIEAVSETERRVIYEDFSG
jgi:tRNA threonylcarbamoyladenosine biosynthesis protein TsaE